MPVTENRTPEDPKRSSSIGAISEGDDFRFEHSRTPESETESISEKDDEHSSIHKVDSQEGASPKISGTTSHDSSGPIALDLDRIDSNLSDDQPPKDANSPKSNHQPYRLTASKVKAPFSNYKVDCFQKLSQGEGNRIPRTLNTYLRPNACYMGEQLSGKARYHIKVEFKTVDLINSVITGFLKISGLTPEHPEISTCFKGEIINNPLNKFKWKSTQKRTPETDIDIKRYSFITENKEWGSSPNNDLAHWRILTSPNKHESDELEEPKSEQEVALLKEKLKNVQNGLDDNQFIYMRWKEEFLLPDSRVKQIIGASFEGFYYTVLNIGDYENSTKGHTYRAVPGGINGLYYHKTSEKLQSLNLRYVGEEGVSDAFEFL